MSGYRANPRPALHPDEDDARGVLTPRRGKLAYGMTNRRLLVATSSRLLASPWLGELRPRVVKRGDWGHLRVLSPRLELRAVLDVEEVQRILLEAQSNAPASR